MSIGQGRVHNVLVFFVFFFSWGGGGVVGGGGTKPPLPFIYVVSNKGIKKTEILMHLTDVGRKTLDFISLHFINIKKMNTLYVKSHHATAELDRNMAKSI